MHLNSSKYKPRFQKEELKSYRTLGTWVQMMQWMPMSKIGKSRKLVTVKILMGYGVAQVSEWKPETAAWVKLGSIMTSHGYLELTMFESVIKIRSKSLL